MKYTEEELLTLLRQDREEGAAALMEQYAGLLWTVCSRRLANEEDIKECVNSAFAEFCLHLDRFDPGQSSLKNYLCRIADRRAMNCHRRMIRYQAVEEAAARQQDDRQSGSDRVALAEQLEDAMDQLVPIDAQILRMKYYDGLSYKEIADQLHIHYDTVKKRSLRSRRKLLKLLLTLVLLALLVACTVVFLRRYQYSGTAGFNWSADEPLYEWVSGDLTWSDDKAQYTLVSASCQSGDLQMEFHVLWTSEEKTPWYREKEWYNPNERYFYYLFEKIQIRYRCGDEWLELPVNVGTEAGQRIEAEDTDKEGIEIFCAEDAIEISETTDTVWVQLWLGDALLGEVALSKLPVQEFEDSKEIAVLSDGTRLLAGPGVADTPFSVVTLLQQTQSQYTLSGMLSQHYYARAEEVQPITLTAQDGTVYSSSRVSATTDTMGQGDVIRAYELYFQDVPAGQYTLYIPYLFVQTDAISQEVTLPLPVEEEYLACNVKVLFEDGSGLHITGITRTREENQNYDLDENGSYVLTSVDTIWRYGLTVEPISGGLYPIVNAVPLLHISEDGLQVSGGSYYTEDQGYYPLISVWSEELLDQVTVAFYNPVYFMDEDVTLNVTVLEKTESGK